MWGEEGHGRGVPQMGQTVKSSVSIPVRPRGEVRSGTVVGADREPVILTCSEPAGPIRRGAGGERGDVLATHTVPTIDVIAPLSGRVTPRQIDLRVADGGDGQRAGRRGRDYEC